MITCIQPSPMCSMQVPLTKSFSGRDGFLGKFRAKGLLDDLRNFDAQLIHQLGRQLLCYDHQHPNIHVQYDDLR
jgi:hypothetical protein